MDKYLLFYCALLSFSGMVIAFYGLLAQSRIEKIYANIEGKGLNIDSGEVADLYSGKLDKWQAGSYFISPGALPFGIITSLVAGLLCILNNPWWTFILVLALGYIFYLIISVIIGKYIQFLAMLTLPISLFLIISLFV